MSLGFVDLLEPLDPVRFMELIKKHHESSSRKEGVLWVLRNEIKPVDIFCYLGGRFGPPNGMQNLLRHDSSDNLIHWEWSFLVEDSIVLFQGMGFRTEVHVIGPSRFTKHEKDWLVDALKADFTNHGKAMSNVRRHLEHWDEFINPYQRIKNSIATLKTELDALELKPEVERIPDIDHITDMEAHREDWSNANLRYSKGVGLCFGVRAMIPVRAESFINLLIFLLMRPELKKDRRLYENLFRQQIDIRVKSLHLNCVGFEAPVDYEKLRNFHALMMKRNDLLHGNVDLASLTFNDVYFLGKVPVFTRYISFWDRAHGTMVRGAGLDQLDGELRVVKDMEVYLLSLLKDDVKDAVGALISSSELGVERKTKRVGALFSSSIADFKVGPKTGSDDS